MSAETKVLLLLTALAVGIFLCGWLCSSAEPGPTRHQSAKGELCGVLGVLTWLATAFVLTWQHKYVAEWPWYIHATVMGSVMVLGALGNIAASRQKGDQVEADHHSRGTFWGTL